MLILVSLPGVLLGEEIEIRLADRIGGIAQPEALRHRVVDPDEAALPVLEIDVVGDRPEQIGHECPLQCQRLLSPLALAPGFCVAQFALHGGHQARELAFDDVIVGARLHHLHGHVLADRARHDDGRKVLATRLQQLQRGQPAEARHLVVGDDEVPRLAVQCRLHRLGVSTRSCVTS